MKEVKTYWVLTPRGEWTNVGSYAALKKMLRPGYQAEVRISTFNGNSFLGMSCYQIKQKKKDEQGYRRHKTLQGKSKVQKHNLGAKRRRRRKSPSK